MDWLKMIWNVITDPPPMSPDRAQVPAAPSTTKKSYESKYPGIKNACFTSDHADVVKDFRLSTNSDPIIIPAELCAGFKLTGKFFASEWILWGKEHGFVYLDEKGRTYPEYPYLHISLYSEDRVLKWDEVESILPKLHLDCVRCVLTSGSEWLDQERLARESTRVQELNRPNLQTDCLMARAVECSFGSLRSEDGLFFIRAGLHAEMMIDFRNRTVRIPLQGGGDMSLPFDGLKIVAETRTMETDSKTHTYSYLFFSNREQSCSVYERHKSYYERGPVQDELDIRQSCSRRIMASTRLAISKGDENELAQHLRA
jgi:hypothetical protein